MCHATTEILQQRQHAEQSQRKCNEQRIVLLVWDLRNVLLVSYSMLLRQSCLQALQKQSQTLTAEAARLSQQLQMVQKDMQDKQQLHKHTRYSLNMLHT